MSRVAELLRSRRVPQVAVLALMSVGFAGCSADMQTRFSDNSFSNPFASQPEATGSVRAPAAERRELSQYSRPQVSPSSQFQSQALPPPAAGEGSIGLCSMSGISGPATLGYSRRTTSRLWSILSTRSALPTASRPVPFTFM